MEKIICKICNLECISYRKLSEHIRHIHNIKIQEYYDKYLIKTFCKECNGETNFKNINIGYRDFCSVKCLNVNKAKNPIYIKKLSDAQKDKPRKKHTEETKKLISENSKKFWQDPFFSEKTLTALRSLEVREKISKSVSQNGYHKNITYVNNIRCESKPEELFVYKCINENIHIERFNINGEKSIKIKDNWRLPDFLLDNVIVDVKDFHPWFKKELFSGLIKYKDIVDWCNKNEYIFLFWFEKYGYKTIEDMYKIKNQEDLNLFLKNNK
jgi:hypothetical protein